MRVYDLVITHDFHPHDLQTISKKANRFSSDIIFEVYSEQGNRSVIDVKSLLGMMMLPIHKGTQITIKTKGADEKEAIDFMSELIENYMKD